MSRKLRIKKYFRVFRKVLLFLLAAVVLWAVFNISLIGYGIDQLKGQLHIVRTAVPMDQMLNDPHVPDSLKEKIRFVYKVRQFAIDSLGLNVSKNYTTFYDQQNKPVLWVITACEEFSLKPYQWKFPFLGTVSYKGFFDYDDGKSEAEKLKADGYDVDYGEVTAWSTLGWFRDPILSSMLKRGKGRIAELVIHEMTHATLYLNSQVDFNENLASVCGEEGSIQFLISTYGDDSDELHAYLNFKEDYDAFSRYMLTASRKLDSAYAANKDSIYIIRRKTKDMMINEIIQSLDTVPFHNKTRYDNLFQNELPNNAYFVNFIRYDSRKKEMKRTLDMRFNGNIRAYLDFLKTTND